MTSVNRRSLRQGQEAKTHRVVASPSVAPPWLQSCRSLVSHILVTNIRPSSYSLAVVMSTSPLRLYPRGQPDRGKNNESRPWRLTTPTRFSLPHDRPFAMIPEASESHMFRHLAVELGPILATAADRRVLLQCLQRRCLTAHCGY